MNEKIQHIINLIQQSNKLSEDLKNTLVKTLNDADKEIAIATFKIERLEKVKYTTTVLLEQTIEELESKRKSVEEQKRQLEIEASLERVRAIAMGMREPDDMLGICRTIAEELKNLNVNEIRNVQTAIFYEEKGIYTNYEFYVKHDKTIVTETDFRNHQVAETFARQMTKGPNEFFTYSFTGNEVKDWLEYQKGTNVFIDNYLETATSLTYYWYSLGPVALGISTYEALTAEGQELFKRFRNVFELAYRRYLDIEKAQAQTKESQIQLALERVRARTMAMQHSDELSETAHILFQQFKQLGEDPIQITIGIFNEEQNIIEFRVTGGDGSGSKIEQTFNASMDEPMLMNKLFRAWKENKKSTVISLAGEELSQWIAYRNKISGEYAYPTEVKTDDRRYVAAGFFSKGVLSISKTQNPSEETIQILERFASVFDLTYTRFLDLKNAEAQAMEAKIEASLERVRSRTMAMHQTFELQDVIHTVHKELLNLQISIDGGSFVVINKDIETELCCWGSGGTADTSEEVIVPHFNMPFCTNLMNGIKAGPGFFTEEFSEQEKKEFFTKLFQHKPWSELSREQKEQTLLTPGGYTRSVAVSRYTSIFIINHQGRKFTNAENDILRRFANVFEQTYTRFLDLQKAEAQAREAQIEAALERVRSRTMAMYKSSELLQAADILFDQVKQLGAELQGVAFAICNKNSFTVEKWTSIGVFSHPHDIDPGEQRMYEAWKNGTPLYEEVYEGEKQKKYFEAFRKIPAFRQGLQKLIESGQPIPKWQKNHAVSFQYGYLLFITTKPFAETNIFLRFGKVFEQTYARFLDLKKAETQAREAQIEAGLERVRSRAMGMQSSEEVNALIGTIFSELTKLDLSLTRSIIWVFEPTTNAARWWMANVEEPSNPLSFLVKYHEHPAYLTFVKGWQHRNQKFVYDLKGRDKISWDNILFNETELKDLPDVVKNGMRTPERVILSASFNNFGGINVASLEPLSEDHFDILLRFAKVFDLTYTRFLDLKKAEVQAREAQVEAALEKVRSRSLAMHKSDELQEVVNTVFQKLKELDVDFYTVIIVIFQKNSKDVEWWMQNKVNQQYPKILIRYADIRYLRDVFETKQNGKQLLSTCYAGKDKNELYNYLLECTDLKYVAGEQKKFLLESEFATISVAIAKNTGIHITSYSKKSFSREETETLKRFAMVFEQAYVRFIDLQKAEAQAKEAAIETALEKVRSRTLAMQKSNELAETASVLFRQLILMGIAPNRLYINVVKDENANSEFWITDEDGTKVSSAFEANLAENSTFKKMYDGWKEQKTSQVIDMQGKELQEYFAFLNSIHVPFKGGLLQQRRVQTIAYFSHGFIGLASPEPQPEETLHLLERFASVFNLTFTRFNDLKIAEAHAEQAEQDLIQLKAEKKKTEEALTNLKATQSQLVQAEKMASLGELTAGIAHEIQNPLNFINNFSEINKELLEEMEEEMLNGNIEDAKAIAVDIKDNELKIMHHGKRADAIVKSMLQHSRKTSGQKEETNINTLVDEYLRLSYHGLRAKDKTFNAVLETNFDPAIGKVKIVGQDIGRVLLNLFNNAFYAVNEKKKLLNGTFEPVVQVITTKTMNRIEIKVKDNGTGIPEKVLDKIYQPFFTTKPTGEGTGLGLSLSYDIITKGHGGEMNVQTKEGEGSEFVILLPSD